MQGIQPQTTQPAALETAATDAHDQPTVTPTAGQSMWTKGAIPGVATGSASTSPNPTASQLAYDDPASTPTPALTADGTMVDGGALGQVGFSSASTSAQVTLAQPAEARMASADAGTPTFTISATIPLSQIHTSGSAVTPAQLAQITKVTVLTGLGTAQFQLTGDSVVLTLAGAPSLKAFNVTTFKLWLASGLTIGLRVVAPSFHTDASEWDRAGSRQQIAQDQQQLAQLRQMAAASPSEAATLSGYVASEQQNLAKDQQTLANEAGPRYVMLDANGLPLKDAPATPAKP